MIRLPRPLQLKLPVNLSDGSLAKNGGLEGAESEYRRSPDTTSKQLPRFCQYGPRAAVFPPRLRSAIARLPFPEV